VKHIFRLLALRGIEVELRFADAPIAFSPAAAGERRIAAHEARAAVLQLREAADAEPVVP
jgi:1-acyl-sn-glycerol-3-phosphate acyltransferase